MSFVFPRWILRGLGDEELIVQPFEAPRPEGRDLLAPQFPIGYMESRWLWDRDARLVLLDIYTTLFGPLDLEPWAYDDELHLHIGPRLKSVFQRMDLVVLAVRRRNASIPGEVKELPPPPSKPPTVEEKTWFEVRFVDEVGDPIGNLELVFSILSSKRQVKTNSDGVARVDDVEASFADVTVASVTALRDELRPRWGKQRAQKLPKVTPLVVRELSNEFKPVELDDRIRTTVAITPYFRCQEIGGVHFDFGRSFVRKTAIQTLAEIAEDLHGEPIRKGMIFGHTDGTGDEALNKELSERRAKAVYAMLTHDADAWEELFTNAPSGGHWSELWGTPEVQHMLNALGVTDDTGKVLVENNILDEPTKQAIKRFQRGEYPARPAEQAPLTSDGVVGKDTRRELFLAYAKRVTRKPLPKDRLAAVNGDPYMGCGEYNPLSLGGEDAESRRVNMFLFDTAAEPQGLPCKLRSLAPCKANLDPPLTAPRTDGKPPYRCRVYQEVAVLCPCNGGPKLIYDLLVKIPYTLDEANKLPHVLIVESEDATYTQTKTFAADARANDEGMSELYFTDLPPMLSYRMRCDGVEEPYIVFDYTPYDQLSTLGFDPDADYSSSPFLS